MTIPEVEEADVSEEMSDLQNCPFCHSGYIGYRRFEHGVAFACMDCGAQGPDAEGSPEDARVWEKAAERWNGATSTKDKDALLRSEAFVPWLRQWCKRRFGVWITHNTAKGALTELLTLRTKESSNDQ